jgi:uridine kinase
MSLVIGIGGISRSGKTTLSIQLANVLGDCNVIHQDHYNAAVLPRIRNHIDWEIPDAVDYRSLLEDIKKARPLHSCIIVEGILIFSNAKLNAIFDKRIVISLPEAEFKKRKAKDLRWGREPNWYIDHIWSSFLIYGYPPERSEYIELNGEHPYTALDVRNLLFAN